MAVNKLSNRTIHAILRKVCNARTKAEKVQILKENNCLALRDILKGSFDDQIQFLLPEGTPPYEECKEGAAPSTLHRMSKRFRYFAVGGPGERVLKAKVERMFIEVLESIPAEDAELVIAMKDKKVKDKYKALTKPIIEEAFPNLLKNP